MLETITPHNTGNKVNLAKIRLEAALRAQQELEQKEAELAQTLRDPLIFYSVILGRCFNKWESHEQDIFVHPKPPNWLDCASKIFRNQLPLDALSH
jgi:hypothetical protein